MTNRPSPKAILLVCTLGFAVSNAAGAGQNDNAGGQAAVASPDGTIEVTIRANGPLTYSVSVDGKRR